MAASNCATSMAIGCVFCWTGCNANWLRSFLAFAPPPPSYEVEDNKIIYIEKELCCNPNFQAAADISRVEILTIASGDQVPVVWVKHDPKGCCNPDAAHTASSTASVSRWMESVSEAVSVALSAASFQPGPWGSPKSSRTPRRILSKPPLGRESPFLLIHFHGNATDIGQMMSFYHELSRNICVDVLGVEYGGYGAACGQASPNIVMQVADAAYNHAVKSGVPPSQIILFGQSIGSGPASELAGRYPVAGVILQSPFLSGIQVLDRSPECCCKPSCVFACCDFFHNEHAVRSVRCPVFIMHVQNDVVVPLYHAVRLRERLPEKCAWPGYFPEGACHDDFIGVDPETYYAELRAFVNSILERNAATPEKEIWAEMATSEEQPPAKLPAKLPAHVVMLSLPGDGINMQTQRPTQPGSGLVGCNNSLGTPHGGGIMRDPRHMQRHRLTQRVTAERQSPAVRPAQVVMVSLPSGGIRRDRLHTQRPTQRSCWAVRNHSSGPITKALVPSQCRNLSVGMPHRQNLSHGATAACRSKSAGPFKMALVSRCRNLSPGTPRGRSLSPGTAAACHSKSAGPFKMDLVSGQPSCSVKVSPGGSGFSEDLIVGDMEAYNAKLPAFLKPKLEGKTLTLGKEISGEMATSEGQPPAQQPTQVTMLLLPSSDITQDHGNMLTQTPPQSGSSLAGRNNFARTPYGQSPSPIGGSVAGRDSSPGTPRGGGVVRGTRQMSIVRGPRHMQTQGPTQSGCGVAGGNNSPRTPRVRGPRHMQTSGPTQSGSSLAYCNNYPGTRHSGGIIRDPHHMQTQRPTQLATERPVAETYLLAQQQLAAASQLARS